MRHAVQRRHAAQALRDSEARYRMIVETAEAGIVQLDAGGAIRLANPSMASMFGVAVGELRGLPLLSLVDPLHRDAAASLLSIAPGSRSSCELRFLAGNGKPLWAVTASAVSLH